MNIIILGAGRVGESVAESLVSEQNDITVIDHDPVRLRLLEDRLDLRGVVGNGIQPSVLREAGAQDADMLIACAAADESNLVVCKVAHDIFNVPSTIARLRSPEFLEGDELLGKNGFAVDHVICPEESVTRYIHQLISYPEALQVLEFADGRASLIAMRAAHGGALVGQCEVKLIEQDKKRCEYLASQLPSSMLILHGDGADEDLLLEENVGEMDLFLALTSDDEDNIMSSMLAKRLGAGRVMALINRRAYADMMQGSTIDIAISPAQTVIGELLTHLRRGDVAAVHSLRRGAAEALEGVARGDVKTSKLVGRRVEEIKLPKGTRIGAIVRGEGRKSEVLMPHHDTVIETDDHIIIFIPNKRLVRDVEKLFQVSATFFG
jgi:Trk K+ transport system NAD-binding subunit